MASTEKLRVTCASPEGNEKSYNFGEFESTVTKAQVTAAFGYLFNFQDSISSELPPSLLMYDSDTYLTSVKKVEKIITSTTELE